MRRRGGLVAKLCALLALGVTRAALADAGASHKAATMIRAERTATYRIGSPKEGHGPRSFRVISLPDFVTFDVSQRLPPGAVVYESEGALHLEAERPDGDAVGDADPVVTR